MPSTTGARVRSKGLAPLPGLAVIGHGYDPFKAYTSPSAATVQLFSELGSGPTSKARVGKRTYAKPALLAVHATKESGPQRVQGTNFRHLARNFAAAFGFASVAGAFELTLRAKYSTPTVESPDSGFWIESRTVGAGHITIPDAAGHRELLTEDARRAVDTMEPHRLFKKFGTHYVTSIVIGGRCTAYLHFDRRHELSERKLANAAEAELAGLVGEDVIDHDDFRSDTKLEVIGGDRSLLSGKSPNYKAWSRSVPANPEVIAFAPDSLRPIWELCDPADGARRDALVAEYRAQHPPTAPPMFVRHWVVAAPGGSRAPEISVNVGRGHKVLSGGVMVSDTIQGAGHGIHSSYPESLTRWKAAAAVLPGGGVRASETARLTAYLVTLHDPDNEWVLKLFQHSENGGPDARAAVAVDNGFVVVGGGGHVAADSGAFLVGSYPADKRTWMVESRGPATKVTAYAIGLKTSDFTDLVKVVDTTLAGVSGFDVDVRPFGGTVMVGGGAQVTGSRALWMAGSAPVTTEEWRATAATPSPLERRGSLLHRTEAGSIRVVVLGVQSGVWDPGP